MENKTYGQKRENETNQFNKKTKIYYDLWSRSMGFQAEYKSEEEAFEAIDYYWNVYCKNINIGKWKKTKYFDYYLVKRNLSISPLHSELVNYKPGSYTEMKKEKYLRTIIGDEAYENQIIENFNN